MASEAPFSAGEARERAALRTRPIPWTCPLAPSAPLATALPPAAVGAEAARTAIAIFTLPLSLSSPSVAVAAQRLEQALLLGMLLAEGLQDLIDPAIAAAARISISEAAAPALPTPAASHLRGRRG